LQDTEFGRGIWERLVDELDAENGIAIAGLSELGRQGLEGGDGSVDIGSVGEPLARPAKTTDHQ